MKLLLAFVGFVVLASQGTVYAKATLEELKAFEKFSPYPWTQWLKFHPGSVAAVAIAPGAYTGPEPEDTDEDDTEDDSNESEDDLQSWFKRATLPEVADAKAAAKAAAKAEKEKAKLAKKVEKLTATKKPSIVDVEPDFWGPPPSIAPNVTVLPPPGYWASKKAMFISKLFAALADAVVNSTGPPEPFEATTTTPSPRQALLNEINNVLLSDVVRSAVPVDSSEESDEDSYEDSDEVAAVQAVTPASEPTKLDFLGKLSSAIAAKPPTQKPTKAPSPWAWGKPTKPTKAPKKSKPVKGKKLKGKKAPPASAPAAPAAGLDYNKLAQALLANGASPDASAGKSKKA